MVKSRDYWRKRFEMLEEAQFEKSESYYKDIEKAYKQTMIEIEKDIARWYQRFADNNEISLAEAKRLLKSDELKELRWTVEEYIKYGEENAFNQQWMKHLENASSRVHISRLESLRLQLQQHVEKLYGGRIESFEKLMKEVYQEQYYQSVFTMQSAFEVGFAFQTLTDDVLTKVISKPWTLDGTTFSSKIWKDKNLLIDTLQKELVQSFARGESPQRMIVAVKNRLDVSKSNAARLVQTEASFFGASAQRDAFKALDVEQYEIVATLDSRTSTICRGMDGKVFLMADFEPGVTANPFHPRCRTTTAPYFEDETGERFARNADGSVEYIDARIKYDEWKNRFVDTPLNQAKMVGKKHIITDQAISKVPYVEIPGYSKEENSTIQLLHQELLKVAKEQNNNNEVMMIKPKSGDVVTVLGLADEVNPATNHDANLLLKTSKDASITVVHNHPGLSGFSLNDLRFFLTTDSVKTLTIVTNLGQVKHITKNNKYNKVQMLKLLKQYYSEYNENEDIDLAIENFLFAASKQGLHSKRR